MPRLLAALLLLALAGCCGPTGIIPSNIGCKVEVSLYPEVTP